jgi:hypothetical protein
MTTIRSPAWTANDAVTLLAPFAEKLPVVGTV